MATPQANPEIIMNDDFQKFEVGSTYCAEIVLGWDFVYQMPSDTAEGLVMDHFPASIISRRGHTPWTAKIGYWEIGIGIIVGKVIAMPGYDRLNLLHKHGIEDFRLYISKETIPPLPIIDLNSEEA